MVPPGFPLTLPVAPLSRPPPSMPGWPTDGSSAPPTRKVGNPTTAPSTVLGWGTLGPRLNCSACGFDASADFAFCPKCGRPLAPACPACGFTCPPGQKQQVADVSYTGVGINDTTNAVTGSIDGTFSTGCLLPDVRDAC